MRQDVISAFLDEEPFEAAALGAALAEEGGRDLLLDLIALRSLVRDEVSATAHVTLRQRRRWLASGFLAAAALFAAAVWMAPSLLRQPVLPPAGVSAEAEAPPVADRVVQFQRGVDWHDTVPSGESK